MPLSYVRVGTVMEDHASTVKLVSLTCPKVPFANLSCSFAPTVNLNPNRRFQHWISLVR
ncbi:unnamed protein product [Fusarium graminearum]|uniref:Chromosome 1, complete genome n=1 Tax=Gibberella zeae (strain ATCC MYA-4620 / CBS 123657 / FGSC 9075 / NRRL 31084 / PH-1) TaxID=229533 RepID=A0A098D8R9_GIBZE|nr:unnamed protein product [Fusarium graminearum]CZS78612.1 unnamed protein product [Fusarium graminearum]